MQRIVQKRASKRLNPTASQVMMRFMSESGRPVSKQELLDLLPHYTKHSVERVLVGLVAKKELHITGWSPSKNADGKNRNKPLYMFGPGEPQQSSQENITNVLEAVLSVLKEKGKPTSRTDVVVSLSNYKESTISKTLVKMTADNMIHIADWEKKKTSDGRLFCFPEYMVGSGERAPRPKLSKAQELRIKRQESAPKQVATSVFDFWKTLPKAA